MRDSREQLAGGTAGASEAVPAVDDADRTHDGDLMLDGVLVDVLVEDVSIDGMCGVY